MKEKYWAFYNWYKPKTALRVIILTLIFLFGFLLYGTLFILPYMSIDLDGLSHALDNVQMYLLTKLYFPMPYIWIILTWFVFSFYKNIFWGIIVAILCVCSLIFQFGMLMAFTSYWDFLIFLPQALLVALLIYITQKLHN